MRWIVALAVVLAAAGCGGTKTVGPPTGQHATAQLVDLQSVLPLRAAFNASRGSPRLLLVLSPT